MRCTARLWTTSIATAALVALPMIATAQTYPTAGSGRPTSGQNPSSQYSSSEENSPQFHLDEAKRVLGSISTSELSGTALSQIKQIKTQFNALYNDYKNKSGSASGATAGEAGTSGMTPPSSSGVTKNWKTEFNTIESELDSLNIPKSSYAPPATSGMTGATGTAGGAMSSGVNVTLPSTVRDGLEQFRTHLEQFYSLTQPAR